MKNIFIIVIILSISLYILYLEPFLAIQRENINGTEGFGLNYKNLCEAKKTHFYDIPASIPFQTFNLNSSTNKGTCSYYCDLCGCDVYTVSEDNMCRLYTGLSGQNFSVNVNCESSKDSLKNSILPSNQYTVYNGEGFVNPKYFRDHRSEFKYKDYLLEQANAIKADYINIQSNIDRLAPGEAIDTSLYTSLNNKLSSLSSYLDISLNNLFTSLIPGSRLYRTHDTSINFLGDKVNYYDLLRKFQNSDDIKNNLKGQDDTSDFAYNKDHLIYVIILFIMIITIIIMAFYSLIPNLIDSSTLFMYFIGITCLVFFIHFYLT